MKKKYNYISSKKLSKEDEYFFKKDRELLDNEKKRQEEEKIKKLYEERKKNHYMKCPKCGFDLQEIEFKKIKIDKCNECDGIWFDKGELLQLILKESSLVKSLLNFVAKDKDFDIL